VVNPYEAIWIARQIRREKRTHSTKIVRRQIKGAEAWSFTWRLGLGIVVMPIGLALCCTIVGIVPGLFLIYYGLRPLNNFFEWQLQTRMAAEEAVDHPEAHEQLIRQFVVRSK
jgi:hypothetical protein